MRRRQPAAERELRVGAVDPGDVRVGDESRGPVAGDELAQVGERARADVDAAGREDDVVGVARDGVGDPGVERRAELVAPPELVPVARERPGAALDPRPRRLDVHVEVDDEGAELLQQPPRLDCAAAHRHDARLASAADATHEPRLELPERGLAPRLEQLPDWAVRRLDLPVHVVERPPEPSRDLGADRRLAGAHEPDEDEVTV